MERRLELSTGIEVELRTVPPFVMFKVEHGLPALPDAPMREIESAAGTQLVPIEDVNAPEYQEYLKTYSNAQEDRRFRQWAAVFSHGIKRWRKKPGNVLHKLLARLNLGYHWQDQPPENWDIPEELKELIGTTGSKRLDYIYMVVLADAEDFASVFQWLVGSATELTSEEVEEAEESFRPGVEGDGDTRGEGDRDRGSDDLRGDEVSDEEGIDADTVG